MSKTKAPLSNSLKEALLKQLSWTREEFDLEVLDGPHSEDTEARWRVRVTLGKRSVILYQGRRGRIMLDSRGASKSGRRLSTKKSNINDAIRRAERFLLNLRVAHLADEKLSQTVVEAQPEEVTLGLVHDLFRRDGLGTYSPKFGEALTLVVDLVERFAGRGMQPLLLDRAWAERFIRWRTREAVTLRRKHADGREEVISLPPVAPVTALGQLKDYDRIMEFAYRKRRGSDHTRLIPANPLREIQWPTYEKALRERASDELYALLMLPTNYVDEGGATVTRPAPVDACDPSGLGILRTIVAVKYHTARRRTAVLGLRCGDVLRDRREVRTTLLRLRGAHRKDWAELFVDGAILFRAELDKNGYERIFPMSPALRAHVDAYIARLECAGYSTAAEAPLFPRPTDPDVPASENTLYKVRSVESRTLRSGEVKRRDKKGGWYTEALYLVRDYCERTGLDPDKVVPMDPEDPSRILEGFKAHAWRGWWATKMERLGYGKNTSKEEFDLDRHVNFMGSWTILGGDIREERYVDLDPRVLLSIACFEDGTRFLKERSRFEEKRTADLLDRVAGAASGVRQGDEQERA